MKSAVRLVLVLASVLVATGCQTLGPGSVPRDRMGYSGAIGDSWKEQMLLNIVKLRYLDPPVYLDVSSVISAYALTGEVSIGANVFPRASQANSGSLGATGSYTEWPTISYSPLTGERLVNSLLRPIPPEIIFAMISAGHPADFILRATVRAINGIYNGATSPSRARREDPKFAPVVEALRRIEQAGAFGVRIEKRGDQTLTFITFQRDSDENVERDVRRLKDTLGIDPSIDELQLVFGAVRRRPDEIVLLTRSMQELMGELTSGIDVPEEDLLDGRATPRSGSAAGAAAAGLVHIRSSSERPLDAYAAVRYRNHWFWVDDRDLASKRVFLFLMMFSSLAETGTVPQTPILTIPAR